MVAVTVLDFVGSASEVAVMLTAAGLGMELGAVYKPPELIVPHALPEHPAPLTLQVTVVSVVPVTTALNCCFVPMTTRADCGETLTATGGAIVTVADDDFELSAFEVAVTITCAGFGTFDGAI